MTSKDATPLLAKRLRQEPKFYIQIPTSLSNVNEITRKATREPDADPLFQPMTRLQKEIIALCAVAVCGFLLLWLMTEIW